MKWISGLVLASVLSAGELRIRVSDESNTPVWTRIEVRGPADKMYQPPGAILDKTARNRPDGGPWYTGSFVVNGECQLDVPAGRYTVIAEHGPEYNRGEQSVDVNDGAPAKLTFRLQPWIRMRKRGWWSGDMHVHRPPEDAGPLSLAEDLNLSVVTTMWNKRDLWADKPWPEQLIRVSPHNLVTVLNAEDERGGGAWMLHGLRQRLNLAVDGRWYPPGIRFVMDARRQQSPGGLFPFFDCEKPIWWETPVIMALEPPDSLGVLHNHFNQYGINANEAWGRPRDQNQFPGWDGFVNYSLSLYYRYLNLGFRVPPSAGSASGVLPNPVGYNRMYVKLPGSFSLDAWYTALRSGEIFVTNGPMLFFTTRNAGKKMVAQVDVIAREPIDRVELVANGAVIHTFPVSPNSTRYSGKTSFDASRYSWIAARGFLKRGPAIRLAHSGPVSLPGKWNAAPDAQYFVEWMDELMAETAKDPKRFASIAEREEVLALYRKARAWFEAKQK